MMPGEIMRLWLTFGLTAILFSVFADGVDAKPPRDVIPSIAQIGGTVVGRDTVEMLANRFGPGLSYMGQHPNGRRAWYVQNLRLQINVDGFDYSDQGRIVDSFSIAKGDPEPYPRKMITHTAAHRVVFMGTILPGMRRDAVLRQLKSRLPPPKPIQDEFWAGIGKEELGWDMSGKAAYDSYGHPRFTDWTAKLMFQNDKLVEIEVECS